MGSGLGVLCAALGGLLLPGLLVGRLLGARAPLEAAFVISQALLFSACLALQACGAPLTWWSVWLALAGLTGLAALGAARWSGVSGFRGPLLPPGPRWGHAALGLIAGLLLARCALQPLSGFDTSFRWGHLAELVLERGQLDFYPPRRAEDFRLYFYVDGIPPLVSLDYWWLYAHAGQPAPRWTSLLVSAQWLSVASLVWRIGGRLGAPAAGASSALALALCPLFTRAVGIGQETGLLTLGVCSGAHALLTAGTRDRGSLALAGVGFGLAALAREYGWAYLAAGLLVAARHGHADRRGLLLVSGAALVVATPWYLRNLALTGNPLYDLPLPGLPRNRVHEALLQNAASHYGWASAPAERAWTTLRELLVWAPLQLLGLLALCVPALARQAAPLLPLLAIGVLTWFSSVSYTEGGLVYSLRVLGPALALLCLPAALALGWALERRTWRAPAALALLALAGWSATCALLHPVRPLRLPPREWPRYLLTAAPVTGSPELRELPAAVPRLLPAGARILTCTDAYAHVALRPLGYEVIPAWSPEVAFAFDPAADPQALRAELSRRGIVAFLLEPSQVHNRWLQQLPLARVLAQGRTLHEGTLTVLIDLR